MELQEIFKYKFDSSVHKYYDENGAQVAGTTSAIGELRDIVGLHAKINPDSAAIIDLSTLNSAAERGTRLHNTVEQYINMEMGKAHSFDEAHGLLENSEEKGAFEAWKKWRHGEASKYEFVHSELEIGSKEHKFAGTIDAILRHKDTKELMLADWKFGSDIPEGLGQQTAAYAGAYKEITGKEIAKRSVVHLPKPKYGATSHVANWIKEGTSEGSEHFKPGDFGEFITNLKKYQDQGLKHPAISLEEAKKIAQVNIYNQANGLADIETQYLGISKLNGSKDYEKVISPEESGVLNFYKEAASEIGFDIEKIKTSSKGNGINIKWTNTSDKSKVNKALLGQIRDISSKTTQKKSLLSEIQGEIRSLGKTPVGAISEGVTSLGEKVSGSFFEAISRTNNLKYAAVGGAIGYVGGAIHEAIKDTSDDTSMYHEERNILGGALKGALTAGVAGVAIATTMNMRSGYSEEFVGSVGSSARGFVKGGADIIRKAWMSAGAKLVR